MKKSLFSNCIPLYYFSEFTLLPFCNSMLLRYKLSSSTLRMSKQRGFAVNFLEMIRFNIIKANTFVLADQYFHFWFTKRKITI